MKEFPRQIYVFLDNAGEPHISTDPKDFASMSKSIRFAMYDRSAVGHVKAEPTITLLHDDVDEAKPEATWM